MGGRAVTMAAVASLLLATACLQPDKALALDARELFQNAKNSVVVVLAVSESGKAAKFGSGVLLEDGNLVATNHHVIAGEDDLRVKLAGGEIVQVQSVRSESPEHDLAILRISGGGRGLPLHLAAPEVGEEIMAIGHPKGLERTLSTGVVSGIRRNGETTVYQITAPSSPGSSGGPILNASGQVIGLASFFATGGQNLNFAIPAAYIAELLGVPGAGRSLTSGTQDAPRVRPRKRLEVQRDAGGITIKQAR